MSSLDDVVYEMNGSRIIRPGCSGVLGNSNDNNNSPILIPPTAVTLIVEEQGNFEGNIIDDVVRGDSYCTSGRNSPVVDENEYNNDINHYLYETDVESTIASNTRDNTSYNCCDNSNDRRCIIHGLIWYQTILDCNFDMIGMSYNNDCCCIRYNYCCAYNHKPYGCNVDVVPCVDTIYNNNIDNIHNSNDIDDKDDSLCTIRLHCMELGVIQPKTLCKFIHHTCCIQSIGSFPSLHPKYINEPIVAYNCIQCYPNIGCGCCYCCCCVNVTPKPSTKFLSLIMQHSTSRRRRDEHRYTLPTTQLEMFR